MDSADRTAADREAARGMIDRRGRDGLAGQGDMLGGLSAGVGDRLGPDADADERPSANQHSFAGEEPAIDAARNYHGRDGRR